MAEKALHYKDNDIKGPGDFRLTDIILYSANGDPVNLTEFTLSIEDYESIDAATISGKLLFSDTQGIIERTPIIGKEYLEFKARTPLPGSGEIDGWTHRFAVFNVSQRAGIGSATGGQAQLVTLEFTSLEAIRSGRTRISKAFEGSYDQTVYHIVNEPWGLNSTKNLFLEPCGLNQKFVAPNKTPISVIEDITERAISKKWYKQPSYFFWETTQGFNFRSLTSMFQNLKNMSPILPKWNYNLETAYATMPVKHGLEPEQYMSRVYEYGLKNHYNQVENARSGLYASKLIKHDSLNKTITEQVFNIAEDYHDFPHLESKANPHVDFNMSFHPNVPADIAEDGYGDKRRTRFESDYADGRIFVASTTTDIHDENVGTSYHADKSIQSREYIVNNLNTVVMTMEVPGNTFLNAGDLVYCSITAGTSELHEKAVSKQYDQFLTGRWLIMSLKHTFERPTKTHTTVLTLSKETYAYPLRTSFKRPPALSKDSNPFGYKSDAIDLETGLNYQSKKNYNLSKLDGVKEYLSAASDIKTSTVENKAKDALEDVNSSLRSVAQKLAAELKQTAVNMLKKYF